MTHRIYVAREKRGLGQPEAYMFLRRAVRAALAAEGVDVPCEVNILLTDDGGIRTINRENRGVDSPTDVLSFPFGELLPGKFDPALCERNPETDMVYLGDMALSIPRCEAQGVEFDHGFERELCYLAVHSTLHLLGYDHMDEGADKSLMRSREKIIMRDLNL
ncbi:MAG: rRNA maturation RNase YbeY [Oscillospiraceae bacterium]